MAQRHSRRSTVAAAAAAAAAMSRFPRLSAVTGSSTSASLTFLASMLAAASTAHASTASTLPYKPTTLLALNDTVYAFQDRSFASFNTSTASNLSSSPDWDSITDELPFVGDSDTSTYAATLTNDSLVVYAGDCKKGDGSIWVYDAAAHSWSRKSVANNTDDAPFMLGSAVGFASTVDPQDKSESDIYAFGGMCGTPSSSVWAWQSASDYTSHMVRLSANSHAATANYNASDLVSPHAPVAAAGFSWTATTPALASKAHTVSQQVDYVMIGGHTSSAFVNMSSVAVWSLPHEAWSFVAVGNYDSVSSRSGHTAVLSENGTSLVLVGGWVGHITQAADPQLVVLKMSDSDKDWKWEVPKNQPSGNGIYGHGATVLPGNVLMVYGGYDVGSSSKRSMYGSSRYYNMTSGEWSDSYSNPDAVSTATSTASGTSSTSVAISTSTSKATTANNTMRNLGLGLGIGLGVPVLLILIALAVCLCRRHRSRKSRDDQIRALAQDEAHFLPADNAMAERGNTTWYNRPTTQYGGAPLTRDSAYESLRGHTSDNAESPIDNRTSMQLPRAQRPRSSSGGYMAASSMAENIDPIYENEEGDYERQRSQYPNEQHYSHEGDIGNRAVPVMTDIHRPPPIDDNEGDDDHGQATPTRHTVRLSGTPIYPLLSPRDPDVNDWMEDVDPADDLLSRLDRHNHEGCTEIRNALAAVEGRPVSKESSISYSTAKSNFAALRNEGPSLLMGQNHPQTPPHDAYGAGPSFPTEQRYDEHGQVYDDDDQDDIPGSPRKYRPRNSWLGSLRHVFSSKTGGSDSSTIPSIPSSVRDSTLASPTDGFMTGNDYYEPRITGLTGLSNAGSALLHRKQGRQAWEDMPAHLRGGIEGNKSSWDIEQAVEQRLVQVMFTVSKERLRVVNTEIEREEEVMIVNPDDSEDASLVSNAGDISGTGSGISLRYEPDAARGGDLGEARGRYRRGGGARSTSGASSAGDVGLETLRGGAASNDWLTAKRSLSPMMRGRSPFLDASDVSSIGYSAELRTAEILRLEKPKSRVREMVDSIEIQSRDGSPAHSKGYDEVVDGESDMQ